MDTYPRVEDPLRVSDLVPLRRMLGAHSMVLRVNPDGTMVPFEIMPSLFYGRPIRQLLGDDVKAQFADACQAAIDHQARVAFRPAGFGETDEVMITPVMADDGGQCRFLVCWARAAESVPSPGISHPGLQWEDLRADDVVVRYRRIEATGGAVIEASPWWEPTACEAVELWQHHLRVSAVGLAQPIMATVIFDALDEIGNASDTSRVRISIPSAEMLAGCVPVFHGAIRGSGVDPNRVIAAIPVELAVDPDLLPVVVHLRTMGLQIDIVGLDALTATLHQVSSTADRLPAAAADAEPVTGQWATTVDAALAGEPVGG